MKRFRFIFSIIICALCVAYSSAQTPESIVSNVINSFNKSKSIKANIGVSYNGRQESGMIIMQGRQFYLSTVSTKCWYNGKVQWTYSKHTGEVNVTSPTAESLQTSTPYFILTSFKNNYTGTLLSSKNSNDYRLKFIPRKKSGDIKEVFLTISKQGYRIQKIQLVMKNNSTSTTTITNYKTGTNYPASTFVFNKNAVPTGTQVVDLR